MKSTKRGISQIIYITICLFILTSTITPLNSQSDELDFVLKTNRPKKILVGVSKKQEDKFMLRNLECMPKDSTIIRWQTKRTYNLKERVITNYADPYNYEIIQIEYYCNSIDTTYSRYKLRKDGRIDTVIKDDGYSHSKKYKLKYSYNNHGQLIKIAKSNSINNPIYNYSDTEVQYGYGDFPSRIISESAGYFSDAVIEVELRNDTLRYKPMNIHKKYLSYLDVIPSDSLSGCFNFIQSKPLYRSGKPIGYNEYKLKLKNLEGRLLYEQESTEYSNSLYYRKYKYDEHENLVEIQQKNKNTLYKNTYDDNGLLIMVETDKTKEEYEHDKNGNEITHRVYWYFDGEDHLGSYTTTSFVYDK